MAFVLEDRVVEAANNPGQGDFELLGAVDNNRTFVAAIGNGNTTRYLAVGAEGWEIGVAEVSAGSPDRLLRPGSVTKNSDGSTSPINFTGAVTVACVASVEDVAWIDDGGILQVPGGLTTGSSIVSGGDIWVNSNNINIQSDSTKNLRYRDSTGTILGVLYQSSATGNLVLRVHDASGSEVHELALERNGRATFTGTIYGNGAGLTNLNASNISSGTLPNARLNGDYSFGSLTLSGDLNAAGTVSVLSSRGVYYGNGTEVTLAPATGSEDNRQIRLLPRGSGSSIRALLGTHEGWTIDGEPVATVFTSSGNDTTNFPIGHTVLVRDGRGTRNAAVTVQIDSGNSFDYVTSGSGSTLSGTWRRRGGGPNDLAVAQRVA